MFARLHLNLASEGRMGPMKFCRECRVREQSWGSLLGVDRRAFHNIEPGIRGAADGAIECVLQGMGALGPGI